HAVPTRRSSDLRSRQCEQAQCVNGSVRRVVEAVSKQGVGIAYVGDDEKAGSDGDVEPQHDPQRAPLLGRAEVEVCFAQVTAPVAFTQDPALRAVPPESGFDECGPATPCANCGRPSADRGPVARSTEARTA